MNIKRYTREELEKLPSETDHERLDNMTDAEIRKAAESDPDNPSLNDEQLSRMKPAAEVLPWLAGKGRGRPPKEKPKVSVTVRLNEEVVEYFKADGKGWQTRLNEALQDYVSNHKHDAA